MANRNDAILQLVLIHNNFHKAREHIISNHQNIDTNKDARITIFSKIIIVLDSTALYFILHQFHLTNLAWWKNISLKKIGDSKIINPSEEVIPQLVEAFDHFMTVSFVQLLFSSLESSLRIFLRALDPVACDKGTAEFKRIYVHLLKILNIEKYANLLKLLRLIRNIIHNNGVYFDRLGRDECVEYDGAIYKFEVGKPVELGDVWQLFLSNLVPDILKMVIHIVNSNEIISKAQIIDPFTALKGNG
jgi:hypothetical protein